VAQVLNKAAGPFDRDDEELLAALSAQAFIALDNARLFESVVTMKNYNETSCRAWPPASSPWTPPARSPA
jgi:adenylate cyclase